FRGEAEAQRRPRARNPYSRSVVMDSGLAAPKSALADLGTWCGPGMTDSRGSHCMHSGRRLACPYARTMEVDAMQKALRQERPAAAKEHHAVDLRTALDWLREQGDLIETNKPVDPDLEVTGLQKHMDGGCPILFENVKGKPNHRVLTNLFGDMK